MSGQLAAVERLLAQLEQLPIASYLNNVSYTIEQSAGAAPTATGAFTLHAVTITDDI